MNKHSIAITTAIISMFLSFSTISMAKSTENKNRKILIVVSSQDKKGEGLVAGFWFPELTHPVQVYDKAGFDIDIVSPKGGLSPFDGFDLKDEANLWFWTNPKYRNKLGNTLKLSDIDPTKYDAIQLVGGHGPMFDFVDNVDLQNIIRVIYENNGIVSAVCHGPAGFLKVKLSNGESLIAGKKLTAFTKEEEISLKYEKLIPFDLETALRKAGAIFEKAPILKSKVVIDGRLITGQNPPSAKPFGEAVAKALKAEAK